MVSCAKYIVEPRLQAGEKLTSLNLQKIMKGSKTVYLLPDMDIGVTTDDEVRKLLSKNFVYSNKPVLCQLYCQRWTESTLGLVLRIHPQITLVDLRWMFYSTKNFCYTHRDRLNNIFYC